jgi:uncharacterized protein YvpB
MNRTLHNFLVVHYWPNIFALNLLGLSIIIAIFSLTYLAALPKILETSPKVDSTWATFSNPIEIEFNLPVETKRLQPSIEPSIKGEWKWEQYLGMENVTVKGKFYPKETIDPEQRVVIYIAGIGKNIFPEENHEGGFSFSTAKLAEIESIYPEDKSLIARNDNIVVNLANFRSESEDLKIDSEPKMEFVVSKLFNDLVVIKPKGNFVQGQSYKVKIQRQSKTVNLESYEVIKYGKLEMLKEVEFSISKEPIIESFVPQGNAVKSDTVIAITFQAAMNRKSVESNFEITPEVEGKFVWNDDKVLQFVTSKPLEKEKQYTVRIKQGTISQERGTIEKDVVYNFETVGPVRVVGIYPENNATFASEYSGIHVIFDQEVDKNSAQEHFSLNPATAGTFSWEGNTMKFAPNAPLGYDTAYTISVTKGIKTVYGLDGRDDFSSSFRVRPLDIILGVPLYYQPVGSFSCNIYTAMMGLAWKGHYTNASSLIAEMGYNENTSGGMWTGNPNYEYVGNSDGSWGYGAYPGAVQELFSNRGIYTEIKYGWNVGELSQAIANGHAVIFWRYNGVSSNYNKDWTASDGSYIYAINGQHGGVASGFEGTIGNPSYIYVNDPWFGDLWMDVYTFDYYWARMNRMALVIY